MLRRSMARKLSAKFEDAATAVLKKTAELAHITGCHAFAAYVGDARRDQLTCHFFTSSALNELLLDSDATALFREQLVDRFQQGQYLPSQFSPIQYTPPSAIIDKVSSYNKRLASGISKRLSVTAMKHTAMFQSSCRACWPCLDGMPASTSC